MIADLKNNSGDLSVVTTVLDDAGSYGRIVRDDHGNVKGIVEYLDADENQIKIREINSGIYLVEKKFLVEAVYKIKNNNSKYEYYLTDIVKIALKMGKKVVAFIEDDNISLSGINDPDQLKEAEKEFIKRTSASV
jgi:bifunctional UDP-N-acetylglucosamine pyrophosphorylase / glucosamine-1-phosphate N-acetyltransferase